MRRPAGANRATGCCRWRTFLGLAGLLELMSCATMAPLDASDANALFATARARIGLGESAAPHVDGEDEAGLGGATSIDVGGTFAQGDFDASDPAGTCGEYEVIEVQVAFAGRVRKDAWDVGGFFGLQVDHVEVEVDYPSRSSKNSNSFVGPMIGFEFGVEPIERLRPYGRVSGAALLPGALVVQGELGVELRLADALRLAGGYRYWRMHATSTDLIFATLRDFDLTLHGPFVGIEASF